MNTYDIGDEVRCRGTFTDASGTLQDPDVVSFLFRAPSDMANTTYVYGTSPDLIKDSTGVYHIDLIVDEAGLWNYRFEATGAGQSAGDNQFKVRMSYLINR